MSAALFAGPEKSATSAATMQAAPGTISDQSSPVRDASVAGLAWHFSRTPDSIAFDTQNRFVQQPKPDIAPAVGIALHGFLPWSAYPVRSAPVSPRPHATIRSGSLSHW